MLPSPSGSTATSITHIVGLGDQNLACFQNNTSKFKTIRVTIHTTGAWPSSNHSNNHVTIFLLLENHRAVQINMRTDANDRRGQLIWKLVGYQQSLSEIKHMDYQLATAIEVRILYNAIRYDWKYHQYRFSAGGSGCHYWNYCLMAKMAGTPDKFSLPADVPAHVWSFFQKWYSLTGAERPNHVLMGEFQSYEAWWNDWYVEDEDEDDDE